MLPLDADSLMSGGRNRPSGADDAAHRARHSAEARHGAPSQSAFARAFQFGMRHGMRSYTMGNAWWNGDCGPYWGHNAVVRVAPFARSCELPVLPGKAPLGGYILSHDQIEATLMRAAGYEVRVLPVEAESWEDNPPSILEFTKRDLRWCQGNMQYGVSFAGCGAVAAEPVPDRHGHFHVSGRAGLDGDDRAVGAEGLRSRIGAIEITLGIWLFAVSFLITMMPKLMGMLDVVFTPGAMSRYGGPCDSWRAPYGDRVFDHAVADRGSAPLHLHAQPAVGRSVIWSGQQRDVHRLSWITALKGMWPQTLFGLAICALLSWKAPGVLLWAAPLLSGLILAVPFAVLTASPLAGRLMARVGLCGIPEERVVPRDLRAFTDPDIRQGDPDSPAGPSGQFAPAPAN